MSKDQESGDINKSFKELESADYSLITDKPYTVRQVGGYAAEIKINQYIVIEVPDRITTEGKGVTVTEKIRDVDGKTISSQKNMSFSVHYDEKGRIDDIQTPQPIYFGGEEKDSVVYTERGGKIYTLPLTKDKYEDLVQKVKYNKNLQIWEDISKSSQKENLKDDFQKVTEEELGIKTIETKTTEEKKEKNIEQMEVKNQNQEKDANITKDIKDIKSSKNVMQEESLELKDTPKIEKKSNQKDQQNIARDNIIVFSGNNKNGAEQSKGDSGVSEITKAVRKDILEKQQLLLQKEIAKTLKGKEQEDFLKQDLTAIRSYLGTKEGKKAIKTAIKNPKFRQEMHKLERDGYKKIQTEFKNSFEVDGWKKSDKGDVRVWPVTKDGKKICDLKETTVSTSPQTVTLLDGSKQVINKYRKIDFPISLDPGNGPMDCQMLVQDPNGKPIPSSEAVYFTAHYNNDGKLVEVSAPEGLRFAGNGPDAIGFVEVNGVAYTIPVTRGKYEEMQKEIEKNKSLDQSLEVEKNTEKDVPDKKEEKSLSIKDVSDKKEEKDRSIKDVPDKQVEIKDKQEPKVGHKKTNKKIKGVESEPKEKQTEAQSLAEKMKKTREERGNQAAEPKSLGGGEPVNVGVEKVNAKKKAQSESNKSEREEPKVGHKKTNKKIEGIESEPKEKQTEAQALAEKMRKSREGRGNEKAEPQSLGGGEPVNVGGKKVSSKEKVKAESKKSEREEPKVELKKTNKKIEGIESEPKEKQTEAQSLAEKMKKTRKERGNYAAEPQSLGGGEPVNVGGKKVSSKEKVKAESKKSEREEPKVEPKVQEEKKANFSTSEVEIKSSLINDESPQAGLTEFQIKAQKMNNSRFDRDNTLAESESRGGGKAVNVQSIAEYSNIKDLSKQNLSEFEKNVKEAAQKESNINAITGQKISSIVSKLADNVRSKVDSLLSKNTSKNVKSSEKTQNIAVQNVGQKQQQTGGRGI